MKAIVDCNSFYCSCERLFRPDLLQKPVVVLSNNDGCIVSRTDEAKKLGIGMAGPYYQAKPLIEKNGVVVFSSNYPLYGDLSMRVMETLQTMLPPGAVEVYSVDEAFLDIDHIPVEELQTLAMLLRHRVEEWTGIAVSVGIASTKTLSKVANKLAKKNKELTQCIIILDNEDKIIDALHKTSVDDLWGIGRRYAAKLHDLWGIHTALQLRQMPETWARKHLGGVVGVRMIKELNGEPCVEMKDPLEKKKMIATTRMFGKPVYELNELKEAVATYAARAAEKLRRQQGAAKALSVFAVINEERPNYDYDPSNRSAYTILPAATSNTAELIKQAMPLVEKIYRKGPRYLKAGVILSHIVPDNSIQGNLFLPHTQNLQRFLMDAMDNINFSMRDDMVKYASSGMKRNWKMRQELRSGKYTTRWDELKIVK